MKIKTKHREIDSFMELISTIFFFNNIIFLGKKERQRHMNEFGFWGQITFNLNICLFLSNIIIKNDIVYNKRKFLPLGNLPNIIPLFPHPFQSNKLTLSLIFFPLPPSCPLASWPLIFSHATPYHIIQCPWSKFWRVSNAIYCSFQYIYIVCDFL